MADEKLVLPLFEPYIEKGEIANLSSYNFYMRVAAKKSQEPFSGETLLLESDGNEDVADRVVEMSRKNHAIEYKAPELPKPAEPEKSDIEATRKPKAKSNPEPSNKLIPKKKRIS